MSEKVDNLDNVKTNSKNKNSSTADQVNGYLAKIQAIVYQYFQVPSNSQGNSVKTVIELNSLGKVIDFRVLTYSANESLNSEVDRIRERLKYVVFPKNPQNKSSRTIIILVSKESN
jgi:protein TonB